MLMSREKKNQEIIRNMKRALNQKVTEGTLSVRLPDGYEGESSSMEARSASWALRDGTHKLHRSETIEISRTNETRHPRQALV